MYAYPSTFRWGGVGYRKLIVPEGNDEVGEGGGEAATHLPYENFAGPSR